MSRIQELLGIVLAAGVAAGCALPALGDVTVSVREVGDDVVISGGGTLDLSAWMFLAPGMGGPGVQATGGIGLGPAAIFVDLYFLPTDFTGPATIGRGSEFVLADDGAGDPVGLVWVPEPFIFIAVPAGYVSGDPLTESKAVFPNHSLASLGLTAGSYTWTWATADGKGDSFTVIVERATGDVDGDGRITESDILALLADWGPCDGCTGCRADIDGDCVVTGRDLITLLVRWTGWPARREDD